MELTPEERQRIYAVVLVVFASGVLAGCTITNGTRQDPGGWRDAKWGMTGPEILKAFGGEAVLLKEPEHFKDKFASVGIDNMPFPGIPTETLKARFLLDSTTKQLVQVNISPQTTTFTAADAERFYDALRSGFVQKYGAPTVKSQKSGTRKEVWLFPSTAVELSIWDMKPIKLLFVNLAYRDGKLLDSEN
jgi:hypothetical protein